MEKLYLIVLFIINTPALILNVLTIINNKKLGWVALSITLINISISLYLIILFSKGCI